VAVTVTEEAVGVRLAPVEAAVAFAAATTAEAVVASDGVQQLVVVVVGPCRTDQLHKLHRLAEVETTFGAAVEAPTVAVARWADA
jgi:hypothetical protein